jgi:hypothetical protein
MDRGLAMAPDAPVITSVMEMVSRFSVELTAAVPDWEARLKAEPDDLEQIEQEVHALTSRGADMVICGLLSVAMQDRATEERSRTLRKEFSYRLDRGRDRKVCVKLFSGLAVWMCSLYCQPKRRLLSKTGEEKHPGQHLDAAQFGIADGESPGLSSRVARQAALCPSFEFAHEELARSGSCQFCECLRHGVQLMGGAPGRSRVSWNGLGGRAPYVIPSASAVESPAALGPTKVVGLESP